MVLEHMQLIPSDKNDLPRILLFLNNFEDRVLFDKSLSYLKVRTIHSTVEYQNDNKTVETVDLRQQKSAKMSVDLVVISAEEASLFEELERAISEDRSYAAVFFEVSNSSIQSSISTIQNINMILK